MIVVVLYTMMPIIGMEKKTDDQFSTDRILRRISVLNNKDYTKVVNLEAEPKAKLDSLEYIALRLSHEEEEKKQKELFDALKKSENSLKEELEKKKLEIVEVKSLLTQNQEKIKDLNNEKSHNIQMVATKDSEIKNLNNKIEELDKKIKEVNSGHAGLLGECAQKEAEYNQVVWHKKFFTAAFLACLVGLIGCVLKIQHVFV